MSDTKITETKQEQQERFAKRDGEMYVALGIFIMAIGFPVLLGTIWAVQKNIHAAIVNAICGGVLLAIGLCATAYGGAILRRGKKQG